MNPKIKEIPWALHFIILTQTISELDDEMLFSTEIPDISW